MAYNRIIQFRKENWMNIALNNDWITVCRFNLFLYKLLINTKNWIMNIVIQLEVMRYSWH